MLAQVWLQEVAWTEAQKPQQVAERDGRAEGRQEALQLQQAPMFCFETALKLLKWSSLTYSDFGQGSRSSSAKHAASDAKLDDTLIRCSCHGPDTWGATALGTPQLGAM